MKIREYEAAGGVVIHDGCMLLLDRPSRGEVRLPKGHIEPGEMPDETALREVQEETGIGDLVIVADLGSRTVEYDYKNVHYRRAEQYYLMQPVGGEPSEQSAKDAEQFQPFWASLDEAVFLLTYEAERDVARDAIEVYERRV